MENELKDQTIIVAYEDEGAFDASEPEKNLLAAMLLYALNDVNKSGTLKDEALEYLLNPDEDYVFSFRSVCNLLNVDPSMVLQVVGLETLYRHNEKQYMRGERTMSQGATKKGHL